MAARVPTQRSRVLLLDAYDSFSNNIVALVEKNIDVDVVKVFIDDPVLTKVNVSHGQTAFVECLKGFDAVIAGPGPGWASCDKDVGLMKDLWSLQDEQLIPVLGICLGFQSLCLAFGAKSERLAEPKHGIITNVLHRDQSIFRGVQKLMTTQYHSLHVNLGHLIQRKQAVRYPAQLWEPTESCPCLEPLAWDFDSDQNGAVLMAVRHIQKPFCGVQFHPESICTNPEGASVIKNWWEDAQSWNQKARYYNGTNHSFKSNIHSLPVSFDEFWREIAHLNRKTNASCSNADIDAELDSNTLAPTELASLIAHGDGQSLLDLPPDALHGTTISSGYITTKKLCELLEIPKQEGIVLESGLAPNLTPMAVGTGRYSIIGIVIPGETLRLHYYAGSRKMQLRDGNDDIHTEWTVSDPWPYIREVMQSLRPRTTLQSYSETPFWGGLMGYASYEAGLETIDVYGHEEAPYPDICFAYITRSVVLDHQTKQIYIQSIRGGNDQHWVDMARHAIQFSVSPDLQATIHSIPSMIERDAENSMVQYIDQCQYYTIGEAGYHSKVRSCQRSIADGQSYELCLTTQNQIRSPKPAAAKHSQSGNNKHSWDLYRRLVESNPAPFCAYIRLHNVHILSCSPERYISWNRSQAAQCRPIKGTVQKKPEFNAEIAHEILNSSKERAENLMIVDLTRHQLHGVYGSHNVSVSQLMEVEEYETLWQLVTVVDAFPRGVQDSVTPQDWQEPIEHASNPSEPSAPYLGFQAFVESLPPGSMTGAPKKRSCEILQQEEDGVRRGIYSGVLGYFDVGGGGDFSVVIRTAFKFEDDNRAEDIWHVGAGGAITSQSTAEGEYEEMIAKFQSTSRAFTHFNPPLENTYIQVEFREEDGRRELVPPSDFLAMLATLRDNVIVMPAGQE